MRGISPEGGWNNIYEFKEACTEEWKRYWNPEDYPDDALDNDTYELYDSGALLMLERFADCILHNKPVPISFEDAANWTAAGLLSADSVNSGSKVIEVPSF